MLDGHCDFWRNGDVWQNEGAGETMFIPRGTEHSFRSCDDAPCNHLVIMTPGGFERFHGEMAKGRSVFLTTWGRSPQSPRGSTSALPDHPCQPRMFNAETSSASFGEPRPTNRARPWRS
ncbi:MAG: hypothetical protein Q8M59_11055 [Tabrizicola sp.]|nr:hypothetical protein [Tabrizicola sp.]MDP3263490.1 hypothetical protein [Tabrizicola sp.]MDP3646847.1 hypothetical protein [Paracoccaceae bacterium]